MQPAYPMPYPVMAPMGGMVPEGARTAKTFILVALIFQGIATAFIVGVVTLLFAIIFLSSVAIFFFVIAGVVVALAVFMLYFGYAASYRRVSEGKYSSARTPTLILAILGFIFGFVIVGIFYLLAYIKIGEAERSMTVPMVLAPVYIASPYAMPWMPMAPPPAPVPPLASSSSPLSSSSAPSAPERSVCPRCQNAATMVPEYQRYYCVTCARYL